MKPYHVGVLDVGGGGVCFLLGKADHSDQEKPGRALQTRQQGPTAVSILYLEQDPN